MIIYKTEMQEQKTVDSLVCDVCSRKYCYQNNEDVMEIQEFHHIRFRGGYSSVFGDDVIMKADICQHCLKDKIGDYLIVEEEN
jgi:hypothetical protein